MFSPSNFNSPSPSSTQNYALSPLVSLDVNKTQLGDDTTIGNRFILKLSLSSNDGIKFQSNQIKYIFTLNGTPTIPTSISSNPVFGNQIAYIYASFSGLNNNTLYNVVVTPTSTSTSDRGPSSNISVTTNTLPLNNPIRFNSKVTTDNFALNWLLPSTDFSAFNNQSYTYLFGLNGKSTPFSSIQGTDNGDGFINIEAKFSGLSPNTVYNIDITPTLTINTVQIIGVTTNYTVTTTAQCGNLGRPSTNNGLRLYTNEECNTLNGNYFANGECTTKNGGSYSAICTYLNTSVAPSPSVPLNILNTLSALLQTPSVSTALNTLSTSIQSQPTSNSTTVTDLNIKNKIYSYYSTLNSNLNTNLPLNIVTTTLDSKGNQIIDSTKLTTGNSIVPLDPGTSITINNTKITRGSLTNGASANQANQITIDNVNWLNYGQSITVGNFTFLFIGSGSPTLFQISALSPSRTPSQYLIPATSCANTYVCPGGGSGYGIQFNIVAVDVDTLIVPNNPPFAPDVAGLTVSAAAYSDQAKGKCLTSVPLTWWYNNYVLKYLGLAGPTPMSCVQPGPLGFAVGLAQTIVSAFGISPTRICNAKLQPTYAGNDVDILVVQFTFYMTDIHPQLPLRNDYLPSSCAGMWMMQWLARSTNITVPEYATKPVPENIPITLQNANCPGLTARAPAPTLYFTAEVEMEKNNRIFIKNLKHSFGQSFAKVSFLTGIFIDNTEHATNVSNQIADKPSSIIDYFGMYAYPFSFAGVLLFTIMNLTNKSLYQYIQDQRIINAINGIFVAWGVLAIVAFLQVPVPKNIFNTNSVVRHS